MRKFVRGERLTGLLVLAFAVLLVTTGVSLSLTVATRMDADAARHSAKADRAALNAVTAALRVQCDQQNETQTRLRELELADVDLQRRLIHVEQHNPFVSWRLRRQRLVAFRTKLASDLRFLSLAAPTPAVCAPFSRTLPTSFRAVG